jgi:hypothetical protein
MLTLYFYLRNFLKDWVYFKKLPTLQTLQKDTGMSCATIPMDILAMVAHALL